MFTDTHDPVMLERIVEVLSPSLQHPGAVFVDATLGLAGHARAVLLACPQARLIGIDRDPDALEVARERLGPLAERADLVRAVNSDLSDVVAALGIDRVDGVLLDLGLSSLQIDRVERGFAYRVDAPLDMRMGQTGPSAADLINQALPAELVRILRSYGEERFAERIVRAIVAERDQAPFTTSARLVAAIQKAIPVAAARTGGHPAKRTFQALRIAVNDELEVLDRTLESALGLLALDGRVAVLAYHSLEDRAVKRALAALATDQAPRQMPVVPEHLQPQLRLLTRGAERPSHDETQRNPRAASARFRAATRIREAS
ncbi:MAG: 16S rRNA (cytosine(1402)-N(4))-methyltransferase RsmH [Arachnia sp.]